jgi:phosphatidate cytidylyltransferase
MAVIVVMAPQLADHSTGELFKRVLSAVVLAPVVLLLVHAGPPYFTIFIALAAVVMSIEWCRLCVNGRRFLSVAVMVISTVAAVFFASASRPSEAIGALGVGAVLAGCAVFLAEHRIPAALRARWLALGIVYVGLACVALIWVRGDSAAGRITFFWLLAVVWAMDIGAYAVGRVIGGAKLAPAISPGKTWAGLIGGMACSAVAGIVVGLLSDQPDLSIDSIRLAALGFSGAVVGALSQAGDLFESWVKRHFGVKDSGNIIPGHGGLLDRVDGLLIAAIAVVLYHIADGGLPS